MLQPSPATALSLAAVSKPPWHIESVSWTPWLGAHPHTQEPTNKETHVVLWNWRLSLSLALQVPIIIHVPGLILVMPIFQELHQYSRNYIVFFPFRTPVMRFVAALSSNSPVFQSLVMAGYGHESVTLLKVFFWKVISYYPLSPNLFPLVISNIYGGGVSHSLASTHVDLHQIHIQWHHMNCLNLALIEGFRPKISENTSREKQRWTHRETDKQTQRHGCVHLREYTCMCGGRKSVLAAIPQAISLSSFWDRFSLGVLEFLLLWWYTMTIAILFFF